MITVYIDGASSGNPGKMGVGFVMYKEKALLKKQGFYIGVGTNNVAEYMALIFALCEALFLGEKKCHVYSDSNLVCEQLNGRFKVKNQNIFGLFTLAKNIISKFEACTITHIEREKNKEADAIAKEATGFLV